MAPKMMKGSMTTAHSAGIFADMTVDGPIIGDLVLVIDRARNLPNRKTMGKQDPYAAARLGKDAKKTATDKRGGQTPKWDQELRFTVHDSADYYKLKVSVFNDDRKTDLIGETWIDLKDVIVRGGGQHDSWQSLNCKGRFAGEIRLEITYYDTREREEKAPDVKAPRQGRETDSPAGARGAPPVKRRPLPQGPSGAETLSNRASMPQIPHTASMPTLPSKDHSRHAQKVPRHMSTDATESGSVDPYEHRHKMMAQHGLPFDPAAPRRSDRNAYNGGPRPVPGQQGFSDLDRLRYRNRGLELPEVPPSEQPKPLRPRHTETAPPASFTEQAPLHLPESQPVPDPQPEQNFPEQNYSDHAYALRVSPSQAHLRQDYPHNDYYTTHRKPDDYPQSHYQRQEPQITPSYLPPAVEEEGPPPPPPVHWSSLTNAASSSSSMRQSRGPPVPSISSFSQGLAHLNDEDDFYRPTENMTQLTTYSEPPAPVSSGYSPGYNHGHRIQPRQSRSDDYDHSQAQHQRSMQDMRGYPQDDRASHYDAPRHNDHHKRDTIDPRYPPQEDFRSAGPPPPRDPYDYQRPPIRTQRSQNFDPYGRGTVTDVPPDDVYGTSSHHQGQAALHQRSTHDHFHERHPHRASVPIIKPRAISPNAVPLNYNSSNAPSPTYNTTHSLSSSPNYTTPTRSTVHRKSVSPGPAPRSTSPQLSGIAFSPDSFDVLNPQIKARSSNINLDSSTTTTNMSQAAYNTPTHSDHITPSPTAAPVPLNPNEPIRDSLGRLVDPSDHLPTSTWAPEPEPKKPLKQPEVKLRFKGAVPMPGSGPRAARPDVELPELRSSVQSSHLMIGGGGGDATVAVAVAASKAAGGDAAVTAVRQGMGENHGRNRIQKKVRVMMTAGGRKLETRSVGNSPIGAGTSQPLRDIPNVNYGVGTSPREQREREVYGDSRYGRKGSEAPPLPAKVPIESGYEENGGSPLLGGGAQDGMDELSREISSIDLGTYGGAPPRNRRTRFATTLM